MANDSLLDPTAAKWAAAGQVLTLDAQSRVIPDGVVWVAGDSIAAVTRAGDTAPDGFDGVIPVQTHGTIGPGFIELHNHVAYNALPLWHVPKQYSNRDEWGNSDDYHRLVTAPMKTVGEATELLPALVRYVEMKALLGGVTTTQGIALFSAPGLRRYYRGIVQNVESPDEDALPAASSRIADVDARDPQAFLITLKHRKCLLLHLSEGIDDAAHQHFEALSLGGGNWAITPALAGIHCAGLHPRDFGTLASRGGSMVWSPFSNLLLYGATADVADAKKSGAAEHRLKIALGPDWSPSGSKSLFGELKVAHVYSEHKGNVFGDDELVRMATATAAEILGWQSRVGTLEPGKRADLVVVAGQDDQHPYAPLFGGDERHVQLVALKGTPRYGTPALLAGDGPDVEELQVGGEDRVLYLKQDTEDPDVAAVTLAEATAKLKDALANIKEIRLEQESHHAPSALTAPAQVEAGQPRLALDEFERTDFTQRPHLPLHGVLTGPTDRTPAVAEAAAAPPISSLLSPIELDPLTVADDPDFLDRVDKQINLPPYLAPGLRERFRG
jgi:cytosine/adenosine deaminase-related metal-dependent hydrolase